MNEDENLDSAAWGDRLHSVKEKVAKSAALEVAGAVVTSELYEYFDGATALARAYAVVPYANLDAEVRCFASDLAVRTDEVEDSRPTTPAADQCSRARPSGWCVRSGSSRPSSKRASSGVRHGRNSS